VSRREIESRRQRLFYLAMAAAAALMVLILAGGWVYEYQIKPNAVLASVNGVEIKRKDYWKYQSVSLYAQSVQYQNYAAQLTGQQQQQYLQFAAQFEQQRQETWGSTDVNESTLDRMIVDQLYLQYGEDNGIDPTAEELDLYMLNSFAPSDAPLVTPIPSPTMIPERAAAETATAEAALEGTPEASPVAASPEASPVADATPNPDTALAEAESGFSGFEDRVFEDAHMSRDDYIRLMVKPQYVQEHVTAGIEANLPQKGLQANAEHILVATEDLANQLASQANGGASFEELARTNSIDTTTSATGGALGWFAPGQMVQAFDDVVFGMQPGQISAPFQTEFGWHIVKLIDLQQDRPYTTAQYESLRGKAIEDWVDAQREAADIDTDHPYEQAETTPTFEAPADAPTPLPATPAPEATPELIGPVIPVASPVASPEVGDGTGAATPVASPAVEASPQASPEASPAS
jgi:parvulin-like peptidyl-prolyl isomerase